MKPLIVANWKCNPKTEKGAKLLFNSVKKTGAVICPPFVYLPLLKAKGAQDVFWEEKGAYTGEVSVAMLRDLGCKYVIVGHSERRKYFNETDKIINKKLKAVLKAGLTPILCISKTKEIPSGFNKGIIAYEPLWAIGTGKACSIKQAEKMRLSIRKIIGDKIRVLYGGSVNSKNAAGYIKQAGFDGLLVGGASLDAKEFVKIAKLF